MASTELSVSQVGKYEILSSIGDGGMASVYQARLQGPAGASKQVALKLIHPHLSRDRSFILMFLDEMRVAMAMAHRNIVQTFDAGKYQDSYFMVMELMSGGSLGRLLRERQPLPVDIALFVAMEVCSALDYAHHFQAEGGQTSGVVHRDVSPGNILLSDQGDVKLADFGVAKAAGRFSVSTVGLIKGKLSYMAPEQARGKVEPRSDLFSVGAVLFRMISGQSLRENPSLEDVRVGLGRLPSVEQDVKVPPGLQALMERCLSTDPDSRPRDAAELRDLLAEELYALQQSEKEARDPHARLRGFIGELREEQQPDAGGQQAKRLADAMVAAAMAVPTDHGGGQIGSDEASSLAPTIALKRTMVATETADSTSTSTGPPETRRSHGIVLGLSVALLVAGGLMLWWTLRPAAPGAGALSPAPTAAPPQDDGGVQRDHAVVADASAETTDALSRDLSRMGDSAAGQDPQMPVRSRGRSKRPRGTGRLDLNAFPWAKVYIDGRYTGQTPLQGLELRAGRHRIRLVNPTRNLSATFVVRIRTGRTLRKSIRLSGGDLEPGME